MLRSLVKKAGRRAYNNVMAGYLHTVRLAMRYKLSKQDSAFLILEALDELPLVPMPDWWKRIFDEEARQRVDEMFGIDCNIPPINLEANGKQR